MSLRDWWCLIVLFVILKVGVLTFLWLGGWMSQSSMQFLIIAGLIIAGLVAVGNGE